MQPPPLTDSQRARLQAVVDRSDAAERQARQPSRAEQRRNMAELDMALTVLETDGVAVSDQRFVRVLLATLRQRLGQYWPGSDPSLVRVLDRACQDVLRESEPAAS